MTPVNLLDNTGPGFRVETFAGRALRKLHGVRDGTMMNPPSGAIMRGPPFAHGVSGAMGA